MAIVGHWDSLAEAQKLTQSMLLKGVVQTVIEEGQLSPVLPVKQITGKSLLFNREDSWTASSGASFFAIREQIPWTSDVTYTQKEVSLTRIHRQDPWDKFVASTYNSHNDYRALLLSQMAKRMTRFLEDKLRYGDLTYGAGGKEFDGLHALAEENTGNLDQDGGETALALSAVRNLLIAMKIGDGQLGRTNVRLLMGQVIAARIDEGYFEAGLVRSGVTHSMSMAGTQEGMAGQRITSFDGIRIIRDDFLVAEQANTGVGSDIRAKNTSGTNQYSIVGVRLGALEDGGFELLFGGPGGSVGQFFFHEPFDKLEDFDSGGERLSAYVAPALGAAHSVGRIYDVTDAAVTP